MEEVVANFQRLSVLVTDISRPAGSRAAGIEQASPGRRPWMK